jgi:hypothetical protein
LLDWCLWWLGVLFQGFQRSRLVRLVSWRGSRRSDGKEGKRMWELLNESAVVRSWTFQYWAMPLPAALVSRLAKRGLIQAQHHPTGLFCIVSYPYWLDKCEVWRYVVKYKYFIIMPIYKLYTICIVFRKIVFGWVLIPRRIVSGYESFGGTQCNSLQGCM